MELFPNLEPTGYLWRQSSEDPSTWRRRTLLTESTWILKPIVHRQIFVFGSLTLKAPVLKFELNSALESAWIKLRLENPEIVLSSVIAEDGTTYIQYREHEDEIEVENWAKRTLATDYGMKSLDYSEMKEKIVKEADAGDSDPAQIFAYIELEGATNDLVKNCQVVLNQDHLITDGTGARILFGKYFFHLALALGEAKEAGLKENIEYAVNTFEMLTPPWTMVMNEHQVCSGPEYQKQVGEKKKNFGRLGTNPGLSLVLPREPPEQEIHFITLALDQSRDLLQAVKQHLGREATITHLGHAAMVLAMLRSSPVRPDPSELENFLISPCWLNGRRYLKPFGTQSDPTRTYIPNCMSSAPITFHDLGDLVLAPDASRKQTRNALLKACETSVSQYKKLREKKSMLPELVAVVEEVAKAMFIGHKHNVGEPSTEVKKATPYFLSDGINDRYVNHSYFSSEGEKVFEVNEFNFAGNAEVNLVVRLSSWRGELRVSGEWDAQYYPDGMVVRFLDDVVRIILAILDDE